MKNSRTYYETLLHVMVKDNHLMVKDNHQQQETIGKLRNRIKKMIKESDRYDQQIAELQSKLSSANARLTDIDKIRNEEGDALLQQISDETRALPLQEKIEKLQACVAEKDEKIADMQQRLEEKDMSSQLNGNLLNPSVFLSFLEFLGQHNLNLYVDCDGKITIKLLYSRDNLLVHSWGPIDFHIQQFYDCLNDIPHEIESVWHEFVQENREVVKRILYKEHDDRCRF